MLLLLSARLHYPVDVLEIVTGLNCPMDIACRDGLLLVAEFGKKQIVCSDLTGDQQGGISFWTNQHFCLHFCSKPIRMRKTRHHMKFVNKHLGIIWGHFRALLQAVFLFFVLKLIYVVLKRIILNFLVGIFD